MKNEGRPHIVVLGGGTGTFTVLSGLKRFPTNLTAVVSMSDNGGSTGILRDELGVLPPGDIRQCLVALAEGDDTLRALFTYRFAEGSLAGHNVGNLLLSVLERICGDPLSALREAHRILNVRGKVIPVSAQASNLHAELEDGSIVKGENAIDTTERPRSAIKRCFLEPRVAANPEALQALRTADLIVIGPGDLYTSLVPVLLVDGIAEVIAQSRASTLYVMNLVTKRGQTDGYTASRFCQVIAAYLGPARLDGVLVNSGEFPEDIRERYEAMGEFAVTDDLMESSLFQIHRLPLINDQGIEAVAGDRVKRSLLRHNSERLAQAILQFI